MENNVPEMIIAIDCFVTPIAKVLATVITDHLVATFGSGDCNLARWALLRITKYFLHAEKFINHFTFFTPLVIL